MRPKIIETPEEKRARVKERNRIALEKKTAKRAAVTIVELVQMLPPATYSPQTMAELLRVGQARQAELARETEEKRARYAVVVARRAAKAAAATAATDSPAGVQE